jgi:hypothetical protein
LGGEGSRVALQIPEAGPMFLSGPHITAPEELAFPTIAVLQRHLLGKMLHRLHPA